MGANDKTDLESRKLLGLVSKAENLIVTSDNRCFASGGDGLYEIDPSGLTLPKKIPIALDRNSPPSIVHQTFFVTIQPLQATMRFLVV